MIESFGQWGVPLPAALLKSALLRPGVWPATVRYLELSDDWPPDVMSPN